MVTSRMRSRRLILLSAACALVQFGCAATDPNQNNGSESNLDRSVFNEQNSRRRSGDETIPAQSDAHYLFMRGEIAFSQERFDEALDFYRDAAKTDPTPAPFLRKRLAQLYVRRQELPLALKELDLAEQGALDDVELTALRAGVLASLKRNEEAIAAYKKLIALTPERPNEEAYILLASLLADSGHVPEAKTTLQELIQRSKDSPFGYYYLARVLELSGDLKGAETSYRKAISLGPDADSMKLDLARCLGLQRQFAEATQLCEELIRSNPTNAAARQLLGQLLLGDNRIDDALKQFETLREIDGDPTDARFKIALIKLERRDFVGAETELSLIVAKSPQNQAAHYYLAIAYGGQGKTDQSVAEIKQIEPNQKIFRDSRMLGSFLLRQEKRYSESIDLLLELTLEGPLDPKTLSLLASLQREAGRLDDAIASVAKIIAAEPENDAHYFLLGVMHDEAGNRADAITAMRKCIALNPKNSEALNYLGYTLADMNQDLKEAEDLIRRATVIDPKNGYYLDSLAWVYHRTGRPKEALKEIEKAVTFVASDAVVLEHYAVILDGAGETKRALEIAEKALGFAPNSDDKEVAARLQTLITQLKTKIATN